MPDLDHDSTRSGLAAILSSRTVWSSLVGMGCFLGSSPASIPS